MRWKQQFAAVVLSGVLALGAIGCAKEEEPAPESGTSSEGGGLGGLDMEKIDEAAGAAEQPANN